jgi:hypothetical protein
MEELSQLRIGCRMPNVTIFKFFASFTPIFINIKTSSFMKRWLVLSLILNISLLTLLLTAARSHSKITTSLVPVQTANSQPLLASPSPQIAALPSPAKPQNLNSWLDALRAAGVPNKILANVIIADFENRWDIKERDLQQKYDAGDIDAAALNQVETDRVAEREQSLRTALGEAGYRQWDKENTLHDLNLGSLTLSDAESDSLYQLRKNLLQSQHDLEQASRDGKIDGTEFSQKLSALQTQYDTQTKALLGDARYAAMNPSTDPAIADLRRKTKDLHPDDNQFTALTTAQKQWNDQRATLERQLESSQITPDQHDAQMQALDAARDQAYQQALGTNAFADFQKSQDPNYQAMKHYSAAWQLNDSDIDYLYSAIQDYKTSITKYERQAQTLQSQGQPVNWNDVQKSIFDFSSQADQSLQSYLGENRFKKLEQNNILSLSP